MNIESESFLMLGQVGATEFDLRFRCFGIPVRVTPWFWAAGVVLGWSAVREGRYDLLIAWLACLFMSILVHEMGHALVANAFGWPPSIILYHFGGLAMYRPSYGHSTGRSIVVSFAGPAAGFLLYGFIVFVEQVLIQTGTRPNEIAREVLWQMKWINLYWGLVNLLPVLPLDGGRISEELFQHARPRDGHSLSLKLGVVVSGAAAAYFFMHDMRYAGILFAMLCLDNVQQHQQSRSGWY